MKQKFKAWLDQDRAHEESQAMKCGQQKQESDVQDHSKEGNDTSSFKEKEKMTEDERKRKRRKIVRDLKTYTTPVGKERAFKGWNAERTFDHLNLFVKEARNKRSETKSFEKAFRYVHAVMNAKKDGATPPQEISPETYDDLWECAMQGMEAV